mgnify:FL=1
MTRKLKEALEAALLIQLDERGCSKLCAMTHIIGELERWREAIDIDIAREQGVNVPQSTWWDTLAH